MDAYWIPGVNNLKTAGRWAFAEFTDVGEMQTDFEAKIESKFNEMIAEAAATAKKRGDSMSVTERQLCRRCRHKYRIGLTVSN
jgi:hypothetical protein